MRLIDVNAVQRWLADWQYGEAPNPGDTKEEKDKAIVRYEVLDIVISGLDDPRFTIEAEPVRNGEWIDCTERIEESAFTGSRCSVCNYWKPMGVWNYCPNCGSRMDARMDGGEEDV